MVRLPEYGDMFVLTSCVPVILSLSKVGSRKAGAITVEAMCTLDAEGRRGTASVLDVGNDDVGDDSAGRTQLPDDDDGGLLFDTEVSRSIVSNVVLSLSSAATDPVIAPVSTAATAAVATVVVNSANIVTLAPPRDPEDTTTEVTVDKSPSSEQEPVDEEKVVPARMSVEVDPTEVKDRRRHDHDNQGTLDVAGYEGSKGAPPPASPSAPPTVALASGILSSPAVIENGQHDSSTEKPSTPSTGDHIGTASSTEVVTVPATSVSISSPSFVGATHLSARERLLRHVRIAASSSASGSDSSSSSSDTDNDDGRKTVFRGEHTDAAQIEDGLICEGRPSGDVNDDGVSEVRSRGGGGGADSVVELEAGKSEADANTVETIICRPRTTRPRRRHREGGDDDDDEHDEPGGLSKNDECVAVSIAMSVSPTNPVVEVVTNAGATGGGEPISALDDPTTTAIEQTPREVSTKDSVVGPVGATSADTLSIHRTVEPCQQDAIAELAVETNINCGGVEESKLEGGGEKHNVSVRIAPSDDVSAVTEGYGGLPGAGRQESGVEEVLVPSLVAATRLSPASEISPDREQDRNPVTEAAGADRVTQRGGKLSVDRHLEGSTTEPIRVNIGESPEKTQGIPQSSEGSISVVAPRLAHSEPEEEENRRDSNAPKVAAKPLAVGPSKATGSSRSQHVGEGGDDVVLGELKEEPTRVDDGDSVVLEELKEEARKIDNAGEGRTQERGDVGAAQTLTEKVAEDTAELAWIEGYDPGHDCYYYHHVPTGESRWYKPDEPYEPYVHSDEEEVGSKPSTLDDGGQSKDGVVVHEDLRDEGKHRKEDDKKSISSRKSGREGGSGDRRKKRGKEDVESGASRVKGSSSRREKSSTKKRRSPKSTGSQRQGSSRKHADDDDYFSCSTSPSSSGSRCSVEESRGDGGRGSRRRSEGRQPSVSSRGSAAVDGASGRSRRRAKTALERLNDLTDEDGGVSGGILSGGDNEYIRKGSSRRNRHHSREAHDEQLYYSKKDRHSGGGDSSRRSSRNTNRDYSPSRKEHHDRNKRDRTEYDDGIRYAERHPVSHARRRHGSSLLSREDTSPNGDDHVKHGRDSSDRRRSTGGRRSSHGSESRRSSTGTAGGDRSRRATREWER